jgi:hypothetical protein
MHIGAYRQARPRPGKKLSRGKSARFAQSKPSKFLTTGKQVEEEEEEEEAGSAGAQIALRKHALEWQLGGPMANLAGAMRRASEFSGPPLPQRIGGFHSRSRDAARKPPNASYSCIAAEERRLAGGALSPSDPSPRSAPLLWGGAGRAARQPSDAAVRGEFELTFEKPADMFTKPDGVVLMGSHPPQNVTRPTTAR